MKWTILKKLPIDLGQRSIASEGKLIAMRQVPASNWGKALDVGCREGYYSQQLADRGYNVYQLDIEDQRIHKFSFKQYDANNPLPYGSNTFDVVWCSEVIEHLDEQIKFVDELRRITKPGGLILLTTPNRNLWIRRILRLLRLENKIEEATHTHVFDIADVWNVFPTADVYGFFPYAVVKLQISRLLKHLTPTFVIVERK